MHHLAGSAILWLPNICCVYLEFLSLPVLEPLVLYFPKSEAATSLYIVSNLLNVICLGM